MLLWPDLDLNPSALPAQLMMSHLLIMEPYFGNTRRYGRRCCENTRRRKSRDGVCKEGVENFIEFSFFDFDARINGEACHIDVDLDELTFTNIVDWWAEEGVSYCLDTNGIIVSAHNGEPAQIAEIYDEDHGVIKTDDGIKIKLKEE